MASSCPRLSPVVGASSLPAQARLQSTTAQEEPKAKANALIEALPGNSLVSKYVPPIVLSLAGGPFASKQHACAPSPGLDVLPRAQLTFGVFHCPY